MEDKKIDFSYSYYERLLRVIKANFDNYLFKDAPQILKIRNEKPIVFLRHDIDLDLQKAVKIAEIEYSNRIKSTFMIMTNCPFYSLKDELSRSILKNLSGMGHEIGLHFDFTNSTQRDQNSLLNERIINQIKNDCKILEDCILQEVKSISFHRPVQQFLRGPLTIGGKINAYSAELMNWYLSDSKGNWREGDPIPVLENPEKPVLQLLTHPIWWNEQHQSAENILQSFYENKTKKFSPGETKKFDDNLSSHLSIFRSGR